MFSSFYAVYEFSNGLRWAECIADGMTYDQAILEVDHMRKEFPDQDVDYKIVKVSREIVE